MQHKKHYDNVIEDIDKNYILYKSENVITGDNNFLFNKLIQSIRRADKIDITVSFIMESGIKMLLRDLLEAVRRGAEVNILTGNYLKITQPQALYLLKGTFKDKINLRFYNEPNRSFHPKSYIFHYEGEGEIYIGSSNISRGALTNSIEWNYRFKKSENEEDFNAFYETFTDLFDNHSFDITDEVLENYAKTWVAPKFYKDIDKIKGKDDVKVINFYEPRGAQIEALYSLNRTREEGFDKALVVAATGIGKTYLSAFDSKMFKRVLFVAHREEIILQAITSFKNVSPEKTAGLFYSEEKDSDKDGVFALVNTLGKDEYLNYEYFSRDYFDYIVIDEFHHAVSNSYQKILNYFKPKFLLGLTATPERMDNKDVFAICDYNVVYELRLKQAINRGELVPFDYYGIYDETVNYDSILFKNGKYDEKSLEKALQIGKRADMILNHYQKYSSKKALGFCTSKAHAEFMSKYFNDNNIPSAAVYSGEQGEFTLQRQKAIANLNTGKIKVIFSVDMFNEDLDVPSIDMVLFLRPTQSPTVFLQQLGRGLRKDRNKEKLIVLDFIGNYKKANLIPFLLCGKPYSKTELISKRIVGFEYPEDCHIDFDLNIIDIFKMQAEREFSVKEIVNEEFNRIKEELNHVPSRVELFTYMDDQVYDNIRSHSRLNPFNDYMGYLKSINELNSKEESILNSRAYDFIKVVETTSMSKTYKMPVLLAFYNNGNIKLEINDEDIYSCFKKFYSNASNAVDMLKDKSTHKYLNWTEKEYISLAKKNPINFMTKTHSEFFYINKKGNMCINEFMIEYTNNETFLYHFRDAIEYRVKQYYRNRFEDKYK
ncbi:MAG: DEAD/DEAH box helicase family protein [Lachnotalea sp.]